MKKLLALLLALVLLLSGCRNKSCKHNDSDENGICDRCNNTITVTFNIYTVSDLVSDSNANQLADYLRGARAAKDNTVILSAGNIWNNPTVSDGIEWMNGVGFHAMTAGVQEFAGGEQRMADNASRLSFPLLAINIYNRDNGKRASHCAPSLMIERGGVQLGIIGAIGDGYTTVPAANRDEFDIKIGDELTALVQAESKKLRKDGADFIIFLLHDGYEQNHTTPTQVNNTQVAHYYDSSLSDGSVDLVLEAGTASSYQLQDEQGVYHLQHSSDANGITHAEIAINAVTEKAEVRQTQLIDTDTAPIPQPTTGNSTSTSSTENNGQGQVNNPQGGSTGSQNTQNNNTNASQCKHTDGNDDGMCDTCKQSVLVSFDFYAINDLHGKLDDTDDNIGVDELTTYFKNARASKENVLLFSAGDMWQGSAESNMTKGKIITDWMNRLDFAASSIGNHEFDWGENYIGTNEDLADFPFLAINIYDRDTNQRADFCEPSTIIDEDGVQIGIIGAIGDCYSSIAVDKCDEVYFKVGRELTALIKAEANRLRGLGADFIVYLLHDGYGKTVSGSVRSVTASDISSYYDTALSDGYVDLVFEGHTHQGYRLRDEHGVYHLQNRGDNKGGISHASVSINAVTGSSSVLDTALIAQSQYQSLPDDPLVDELLKKYAAEIEPANKVLGYNSRQRNSTELCQIMANLYYQCGVKTWGDEYDIVLGGGFLNTRSPYRLSAGDVTYADLQAVFPFDNQLVLCSVSGRNLQNKFFNNSDYYIAYDSYGSNIKNNINANATYYIVVDTYTADYRPNNLTVVKRYDETTFGRDLMAEYITGGGLS